MYEKLVKNSAESTVDELLKDRLFHEFENSVNSAPIHDPKKPVLGSIEKILHNTVQNAINNVVSYVSCNDPSLSTPGTVTKVMSSIQKFFQDSDFGTFEYLQKTGRALIRIEHSQGFIGTEFLKKFFEKIFKVCLKDYSFYVISTESYVCVMFR
ncbi:hypothetical protein [Nitrosopumilus ureiphilus]|uniref:Uncharacterized protein n=1 Tax=Nitrosopumilus ureiphilus TaxID=1470067 RepID=A0A7D5M4B4_9ARCH|nr:hypothetical protein [Nitrosopumilus ureiphilus]QLH06854.1 hypothetical protein C5F50_07015 [Nitrosopumilus ureiphilus]